MSWNYFRFKVSYGSHARKVDVFAPDEQLARLSTGAFEDEKIELLKEISGHLVLGNKSRIEPKELILLLKNLQKCLQSGASVSKALQITISAVKKPLTRGIIGVLIDHTLKNGLQLSEAMERVGEVFDAVTIAAVKAGERSGELPEVLGDLSMRLEQSQKIKKKVLSGLSYPMVVILFTIIAAVVINFFVFPSIIRNFKMLDAELPKVTQWMAYIVESTSAHPELLLIPVLGLVAVVLLRRRIVGSRMFQRTVIKMPIIGGLIGGSILVRSLHTLSLLLKTGTNVIEAYNMTIAIAGNISFQEYFSSVLEYVKKGDTPDIAFSKERYRLGKHSAEIANLMRISSFTGEDWRALEDLAHSLGEDVNLRAEALPKLIEPILLLFIAAVVGLMIAAIYLPSFYLLLNAFKS